MKQMALLQKRKGLKNILFFVGLKLLRVNALEMTVLLCSQHISCQKNIFLSASRKVLLIDQFPPLEPYSQSMNIKPKLLFFWTDNLQITIFLSTSQPCGVIVIFNDELVLNVVLADFWFRRKSFPQNLFQFGLLF